KRRFILRLWSNLGLKPRLLLMLRRHRRFWLLLSFCFCALTSASACTAFRRLLLAPALALLLRTLLRRLLLTRICHCSYPACSSFRVSRTTRRFRNLSFSFFVILALKFGFIEASQQPVAEDVRLAPFASPTRAVEHHQCHRERVMLACAILRILELA